MTATPPENSIHPKTRAAWRAWLAKHHARRAARDEGIWLISYRLAAGKPRLTYDDAVEEALCFGWIDSKPAKLDDERTMLWYSPRKPKSGWSAINKERIAKMIAAGKMHPAGMAKVDAAKLSAELQNVDLAELAEADPEQAMMLADLTVKKQVADKIVKRIVIVPGRLINIVV